jgi:hypothetical protein
MRTLIYIFAFFVSGCALAQPQLGMSHSYTITPPTALSPAPGIAYDSVVKITCRIINKGTANFGPGSVLNLQRAVKSGSVTSAVRVVYTSSATVIIPGDSVTVTITDSILSPAYKINGNGNTIVVWPYSSAATTTDSLKAGPVYVSDPTGIEELDRNKLFIYPNPTSHMLFIQTEQGKRYKELIIYDMQLKELVRKPFEESTDIGLLPPGTYIISVSDAEGKLYSSRFIKNN